MKKLLIFCVGMSIHCSMVFASIPLEVTKLIPKQISINQPKNDFAKAELEDLVQACGPGVIEGTPKRAFNKCHFKVKLDDLFFADPKTKLGLLHEENWAYQDNVTWFQPIEKPVAEKFDLRDLMLNGQPDIRQQNCGDCWAWSTHHGLEIARAVHDQKALDLSTQSVLSCSKSGSCWGGYMSAVAFLLHGLPLESEFPYAGYDKSCKYSSAQIQTGWDGKIIAAPYIGNSLRYSRAMRNSKGEFDEGTKVTEMMNAMEQYKGPLVVTVASYSMSGAGVYDNCSAINSGGNHMVAVVGWDTWNGKRVAHVWNSHGKGHGENGVSRIVWECGNNQLNRGLGVSARIVQYKPTCVPPDASQKGMHEMMKGQSVTVGAAQVEGTQCSWMPTEGLADPFSCVTNASPTATTEYHLKATNPCGTSSSMVLVDVWGRNGVREKFEILTPYGKISRF